MEAVKRVRHWLYRRGEDWDDWLCDRSWSRDWMFTHDRVKVALCVVLGGHASIEDHCGKPEHDYCLHCGQQTPNGAHAERVERLRAAAEIKKFRADPGYPLEPRLRRLVEHLDQAAERLREKPK